MPGTFSPPPRASNPDMHHGTCVTHVPWCMPGSLTSSFFWSRWLGKRSRHSRRMRNPQFYVSGKRPMKILHQLSIALLWLVLCLHAILDWYTMTNDRKMKFNMYVVLFSVSTFQASRFTWHRTVCYSFYFLYYFVDGIESVKMVDMSQIDYKKHY